MSRSRKLVRDYLATVEGAATPEPMQKRLEHVVAAMPHLFKSVEHVHVLRWSMRDEGAALPADFERLWRERAASGEALRP